MVSVVDCEGYHARKPSISRWERSLPQDIFSFHHSILVFRASPRLSNLVRNWMAQGCLLVVRGEEQYLYMASLVCRHFREVKPRSVARANQRALKKPWWGFLWANFVCRNHFEFLPNFHPQAKHFGTFKKKTQPICFYQTFGLRGQILFRPIPTEYQIMLDVSAPCIRMVRMIHTSLDQKKRWNLFKVSFLD